jgi:hypothetical protein
VFWAVIEIDGKISGYPENLLFSGGQFNYVSEPRVLYNKALPEFEMTSK